MLKKAMLKIIGDFIDYYSFITFLVLVLIVKNALNNDRKTRLYFFCESAGQSSPF